MASRSSWLTDLRGFPDLAAAQTARADAHPLGGAVDQRTDRLQVRLETPGSHIVGVGHGPADDRAFVTDFAPLRHDASRWGCWVDGSSMTQHPRVSALGDD